MVIKLLELTENSRNRMCLTAKGQAIFTLNRKLNRTVGRRTIVLGRAQLLLSDLTVDVMCHYDTSKTLLMQGKGWNRKPNRDETGADYGYTLKRLGSREFFTIPMIMSEGLIVEQFISRPGRGERKPYVQFSPLTTNASCHLLSNLKLSRTLKFITEIQRNCQFQFVIISNVKYKIGGLK